MYSGYPEFEADSSASGASGKKSELSISQALTTPLDRAKVGIKVGLGHKSEVISYVFCFTGQVLG